MKPRRILALAIISLLIIIALISSLVYENNKNINNFRSSAKEPGYISDLAENQNQTTVSSYDKPKKESHSNMMFYWLLLRRK